MTWSTASSAGHDGNPPGEAQADWTSGAIFFKRESPVNSWGFAKEEKVEEQGGDESTDRPRHILSLRPAARERSPQSGHPGRGSEDILGRAGTLFLKHQD